MGWGSKLRKVARKTGLSKVGKELKAGATKLAPTKIKKAVDAGEDWKTKDWATAAAIGAGGYYGYQGAVGAQGATAGSTLTGAATGMMLAGMVSPQDEPDVAPLDVDFVGEGYKEASSKGLITKTSDKKGLAGLKIKRDKTSSTTKQLGTGK